MSADTPDETSVIPGETAATFVQSARSLQSGDGRLSLRGISPATLYFADAPQPLVGHITSRQFVDMWVEGEHNFADDPPCAVLAFVGDSDRLPGDVVLMLRRPHLSLNTLAYACDVIEGSLPRTAGACSLFIEPPGRPLSPGSVMGLHREGRRVGRRFF